MMFFLNRGFRVIAHDRRGHGRSTQTGDGHDMDHYADDLGGDRAPQFEECGARRPLHRGWRGGPLSGSARPERGRKAAIIAAVPPLMVKTPANPAACPRKSSTVSRHSSRRSVANSIAIFRRDFLRVQPAGAKTSEAIIQNWWRQGMMGRREGTL